MSYSSTALTALSKSVCIKATTTRFTITLIIAVMMISSPILMFVNPGDISAAATDNSNKVDTSNYHSNPHISETSSSSTSSTPTTAPLTISQDGSDFTTQAAVCCLTARPTNNIVNTNSFYDVVFLTASSGTIKKIEVAFPAGTTIPSGAFFNEAEGIGPGTASKSGQTITYTVDNAVNVPAGTKIRLEFANINNPLNPSAFYKVTVTTRDSANAIIDGPTQSTAYTVKQVGVNSIADGHITTPKIADGAITSTKPAESFMKRVTLLDDSAGNALGWNPDGVTTDFLISEATVIHETIIVINIDNSADNSICNVTNSFIGSPGSTQFKLECTGPPINGTDLHYVVINLPPHVAS